MNKPSKASIDMMSHHLFAQWVLLPMLADTPKLNPRVKLFTLAASSFNLRWHKNMLEKSFTIQTWGQIAMKKGNMKE